MKDKIDKIFDLLEENGKVFDKLDIPTINDIITEFIKDRRGKSLYTVTPLEKGLRWLRAEMFEKGVNVVYR